MFPVAFGDEQDEGVRQKRKQKLREEVQYHSVSQLELAKPRFKVKATPVLFQSLILFALLSCFEYEEITKFFF